MLFAYVVQEPRHVISQAFRTSTGKCKLMRTTVPSNEPQAWSTHRSISPLYDVHSDGSLLTRRRDKIQVCVSLLSLMGLSGVDHPSILYPELITA